MAMVIKNNEILNGNAHYVGKGFLIEDKSSLTFTPSVAMPYLVFTFYTSTKQAIYRISYDNKIRILGDSDYDDQITVNGYGITIRNSIGWTVPCYIMAL